MSKLSIEKQGVRGGAVRESSAALITLYDGNARILSVDNYYGYGNSYKQRPEPIIVIFDGQNSPNEEVIFEGTQKQLVELLKKAK